MSALAWACLIALAAMFGLAVRHLVLALYREWRRRPPAPSAEYRPPVISLDPEPFTFSTYYADRSRLDAMILDLSVPVEAIVAEVDCLVRREVNSATYYREHPIEEHLWPHHPWGRFVDAGHAGYLGWFASEGRVSLNPRREDDPTGGTVEEADGTEVVIRTLSGRTVRIARTQ